MAMTPEFNPAALFASPPGTPSSYMSPNFDAILQSLKNAVARSSISASAGQMPTGDPSAGFDVSLSGLGGAISKGLTDFSTPDPAVLARLNLLSENLKQPQGPDTAAGRLFKNTIGKVSATDWSNPLYYLNQAREAGHDFLFKPLGETAPAVTLPSKTSFDLGSVFTQQQGPTKTVLGGNRNYLTKLALQESGGDHAAQSETSSAAGLTQFIGSTWLNMIKKYRPDLAEGRDNKQLLALRFDPKLNLEMAKHYGTDNSQTLSAAGVPINDSTLATAHRFGPGGAIALAHADPATPIKDVIDADAYEANPDLHGKTVGQVLGSIQKKFGTDNTLESAGEGFPTPTKVDAAQLPQAPTLKTPAGVDTSGYLAALEKGRPTVDQPGQYDWLNRLGTVLGGAAGQTTGLHRVSDILAAAGGGAVSAGRAYDKDVADRLERQKDRLNAFNVMMANAGLSVAQIEAQNKNLGVTTENQNLQNRYQRDTQQATLDAQAKQLNAHTQDQFNLQKFQFGQPQINATADNITVSQRDPNTGKVSIETIPLDGSTRSLKKVEEVGKAIGKDNPSYQLARDMATAKLSGVSGVRTNLLNDALTSGAISTILGKDSYKKFDDAVKAEVPAGLTATAKYQDVYNEKAMSVLQKMATQGKLTDYDLLKELALRGNSTAKILFLQNFGEKK